LHILTDDRDCTVVFLRLALEEANVY